MLRPMNDIRTMPSSFARAKSAPHRTDRDIERPNGMSTKRDVRNVQSRSPRRLFIKEAGLVSVIPVRETV